MIPAVQAIDDCYFASYEELLTDQIDLKSTPCNQEPSPIRELFNDLDTLENEKEIYRVAQKISQMPFLDLMESLLERSGKPISSGERSLLTVLKRRLPHLNKTLISYELLQRQTQQMDLSKFKPIQLKVEDQSFDAYDMDGADFQWIVHSAKFDEWQIDETLEKKEKKGTLSVSAVSPQTEFFAPYACFGMVLDCDPKSIVATIREDGMTPKGDVPDRRSFYHFRQRLQIFTSYVDELYRESGLQGKHPTDDLSRFNRLSSLQDLDDEARNDLDEIRENILQRKDALDDVSLFEKYKEGITSSQLESLALHYRDDREKLLKIKRCQEILQRIQKDFSSYYSEHIHPIQSPSEILRQTPYQPLAIFLNPHGLVPYNEINLILDGKGALRVRAILIHSDGFDNVKCRESLLNLLRVAKGKKLPIFFKATSSPAALSLERALTRFASRADMARRLKDLLESQSSRITDIAAGEALVKASKANIESVELLLKFKPNIPLRFLKKVLENCPKKEMAELLVQYRPETAIPLLRPFEGEGSEWVRVLIEKNIAIPPDCSEKAVVFAAKDGDIATLKKPFQKTDFSRFERKEI